jgi:hypothetical protein
VTIVASSPRLWKSKNKDELYDTVTHLQLNRWGDRALAAIHEILPDGRFTSATGSLADLLSCKDWVSLPVYKLPHGQGFPRGIQEGIRAVLRVDGSQRVRREGNVWLMVANEAQEIVALATLKFCWS